MKRTKQLFKSDGLLCPMTREEFAHWIAKQPMPLGSTPDQYRLRDDAAWRAYKRGLSDQKKVQRS